MSNPFKDILAHTESGVTTITLNRIDKKNSITSAMYAAMADALDAAATDAAVYAVVIQGHESIFSAGNDIADFLNGSSLAQDSPVFRFLRGISSFPKPLVAAVCGPAVGVGTTMLLHCDLVYVADTARLTTPFVNLALVPEAASSLLLPARIGHARAFAMFALGEVIDAATAVAIGLANAMVPQAELRARARAAAETLATRPLGALAQTKMLMRNAETIRAQMDHEGTIFQERLKSAEAREAFTAFAERRAPDFSRITG